MTNPVIIVSMVNNKLNKALSVNISEVLVLRYFKNCTYFGNSNAVVLSNFSLPLSIFDQ